ncbi:TetR/AcrR family transcriptional regulator [Nonomuraea sp. FMUSA5-5]|uniref:TetR/AcrR family transcriptional regulator n=1 Tax=Nonomuraea composti TaxID=2720023 RepID=A0ABX1BJ29_9ACTN|nr:TetR/AcrR family transcriptional regulator [Nonomuraea sp. FMUSA5-5]
MSTVEQTVSTAQRTKGRWVTAERTAAAAPARGTRPRNRRTLIIEAAAELFARHGYDQVAMSDVADAMNVRPSALYRHFAGKPRLLTAVVLTEIEPFERVLATGGPVDRLVPRLADVALEHRRLGVLWQREARALPEEERGVLRDALRSTAGRLAVALLAERPGLGPAGADLLSWCAWSVLNSAGHSSVELPRAEYASLLEQIVRPVLALTPPPQATAPAEPDDGFDPRSRREKLLAAAVPLFAAQGYAGVRMEDIGARAGIAGPSVYHHFTSKQDILHAVLNRGSEWLRQDLHRALARASGPADALSRLADSYVRFAADNSALIDVLISDVRHLPGEQRAAVVQAQQDYLGEWQHRLRLARPRTTAMQARARVHAALAVVNDIARTPHLRAMPGALETVRQAALLALLGCVNHHEEVVTG